MQGVQTFRRVPEAKQPSQLRYGEEKGEEVLKSRWKNSRFDSHEL